MAGCLGLELRGRNPSVMNNDAPIGVFDSGIGGLTVAREIMRQIPNERIVYFGDTMRLPYGSKSKDNIILCSRQIISFLQSQGVKAVVIACNTASALALEENGRFLQNNLQEFLKNNNLNVEDVWNGEDHTLWNAKLYVSYPTLQEAAEGALLISRMSSGLKS